MRVLYRHAHGGVEARRRIIISSVSSLRAIRSTKGFIMSFRCFDRFQTHTGTRPHSSATHRAPLATCGGRCIVRIEPPPSLKSDRRGDDARRPPLLPLPRRATPPPRCLPCEALFSRRETRNHGERTNPADVGASSGRPRGNVRLPRHADALEKRAKRCGIHANYVFDKSGRSQERVAHGKRNTGAQCMEVP